MRTIGRRIGKLENYCATRFGEPKVLRLIVSLPWKPVDLAASKCHRTLCTGNTIMERVDVDGDASEIGKEELEAFVASFPVVPARRTGTR